jgi:hypothetical protein
VAVHTAWGSFWIGWGILELLVATHVMPPIPLGATSPSFAFWFIALALVTSFGAWAPWPRTWACSPCWLPCRPGRR